MWYFESPVLPISLPASQQIIHSIRTRTEGCSLWFPIPPLPSAYLSRKRKRLQKKINPPQKSRSRAKFRKQNAYRCFVVGLSSHLCLILQTTTYLRTNQHISIARSGSGKVDGNRRQSRGSREKKKCNKHQKDVSLCSRSVKKRKVKLIL